MTTKRPSISPTFLVGAMYEFWDGEIKLVKSPRDDDGGLRHAAEAVRTFLRGRARELNGYEPVASRGGLVALRRPRTLLPVHGGASRPRPPSDLRVCNPVNGELFVLPPPAPIRDQSHVLLPCDDAHGGRGFKLHVVNIELLAYGVLQIQSYPSETGTWSRVVATYANLPRSTFLRPSPLVLRGVAYWLCMSSAEKLGCYILALHLDGSRRLASIKLPDRDRLLKGRQRIAGEDLKKEEVLLASSSAAGGSRRKLSLAVVNNFTISLWTLEEEYPAARWTHTAVVDLWKMTARCADAPPLTGEKVRLECFAESSGAVLFQLYHGTLYELDVQTGAVRFVGVYSKRSSSGMCAYDMDYRSAN